MPTISEKLKVSFPESVRVTKDGQRLDVSISIAPIREPGGRIVGASAIARDVTAQKRAEEHLRQAQKMEAVGRLAGGVAHDFNNLLTIINGYSSLLLKELRPGDPLYTYAQEISKAGNHAAGLTRQLLAFSRKQILQPKVLDLNALISQTAELLPSLLGPDVVLDLCLDPVLGRVRARDS